MNDDGLYVSDFKDGSAVVTVHVQPKASRACFRGVYNGALKLAVTAPPVEGKANKAVIEFLASFFRWPKGDITLVSGQSSRRKRLVIVGMSREEALKSLEGNING